MSLHTVKPEKLSNEQLWLNLRKLYPELKLRREWEHGSAVTIYSRITDGSNMYGHTFYFEIVDDYYEDSFLTYEAKTISEVLEKAIQGAKDWIADNPEFVDDDVEPGGDDY